MPEEYAGKIRTRKDAEELVKEQHEGHVKGNFQWLDQKTADTYRKKSKDAQKEGHTGNTKETLKKEKILQVRLTRSNDKETYK